MAVGHVILRFNCNCSVKRHEVNDRNLIFSGWYKQIFYFCIISLHIKQNEHR